MKRGLVVGLGAVDRGDDGVGPVVVGQVQKVLAARVLADLGPQSAVLQAEMAEPAPLTAFGGVSGGAVSGGSVPGGAISASGIPEAIPEVVVHEDPTALVDLMAGRSIAVIVDALRSPGQPGSVHVLQAGQSPLPAPTDPGPAGSHGFGLASSLELARALGSLPPRVVVVGVVGTRFTVGAPLSDPVAGAVPVATAAVLSALAAPPGGSSPGAAAEAKGAAHWVERGETTEVRHVH